jgi:hypothetical protein
MKRWPGKTPFDIQFGFSKRLHTLLSLVHPDAWYQSMGFAIYQSVGWGYPNLGFGEDTPDEPSNFSEGVDNFFRHFVFGGEVLIEEGNLDVALCLSSLACQELSVVNLLHLPDFQVASVVMFNFFVLDYGFAVYHQAGASNHLGIRVPLRSMKEKTIVN